MRFTEGSTGRSSALSIQGAVFDARRLCGLCVGFRPVVRQPNERDP